jgi:hypothetical protein
MAALFPVDWFSLFRRVKLKPRVKQGAQKCAFRV